MLVARTVRIDVPDGPSLHCPWSVTQDPGLFDTMIGTTLEISTEKLAARAFVSWLERRKVGDQQDRAVLTATYESLRQLRERGRNHIWGYVARNLARPIWLSSEGERADIVLGNPPWLSYRFMSRRMQAAFRAECTRMGVWAGGKVATQQDLSGYFFARCVELYLKPGSMIAFVCPTR